MEFIIKATGETITAKKAKEYTHVLLRKSIIAGQTTVVHFCLKEDEADEIIKNARKEFNKNQDTFADWYNPNDEDFFRIEEIEPADKDWKTKKAERKLADVARLLRGLPEDLPLTDKEAKMVKELKKALDRFK